MRTVVRVRTGIARPAGDPGDLPGNNYLWIRSGDRTCTVGHFHFICTVKTIDDFKNLDTLAKDAVILSTGDPMLAGLGYLAGEVIPGISSSEVVCSPPSYPFIKDISCCGTWQGT